MAFDCYASPLQPIISTLEILKLFGGFPLKILDQDGTTFHFQPIRGIALSVMLPMSLIILINIVLKDLRQTLVVLPDRNSKMEIAKLSGTELITGFLQFLPNVCGLVIVIILFLKGHKGLSHLCHAIKGFNSDGKIAGDYSRLGSRNVTIILGFYILILFSGFGLIVYFYLIMGSNPIPWDTFVILALLIVLQFFLVFFPVAMASSYLICQQILGSFKILLSKYAAHLHLFVQDQRSTIRHHSPSMMNLDVEPGALRIQLATSTSNEMLEFPDKFQGLNQKEQDLVSKGFHLLHLLEMTDEVLGPFLVLESIISLMSQVFGAFFSTNVMLALHGEAFQPIQFTFGVAATFGAFHWFLRLFFLFESGQKIVRQMVHVRRNLEVIFMNGCDTRDNQTQHKLKILLKRFGNFYPIRPCGSFTLCRSSAISAGGVLLTYIIVLLEFRFSETDQKSCAHPPYWNATQPELLN